MKWGIGFVLFVALWGAAPAGAYDDPPARLARMQATAVDFFPDVLTRCPRGISVVEDPSWQFAAVEEPWGGDPYRCALRINPGWPDWPRSFLCRVVVHEYGHLAGLDHVDDPHNVMSINLDTTAIRSVPACGAIWRLEQRELRLFEWTQPDAYIALANAKRAKSRLRIRRARERVLRIKRQYKRVVQLLGP